MKNYRGLVPIILIVLLGLSWYYVVDNHEKVEAQYSGLVSQFDANIAAKNTFQVHQNYDELNRLRPSLEIGLKMSDYIRDNENTSIYTAFLKQLTNTYPTNDAPYLRTIAYQISSKDYQNVYKTVGDAQRNAVDMTAINQLVDTVKYKYQLRLISGVSASPFSQTDKIAAVQIDGDTYQYLNADGSTPSKQFKRAGAFINGFGNVVNQDGKPQFVDSKYQVVYEIGQDYREFGAMSTNNVFGAKMSDGWWKYLNTDFTPLLSDDPANQFNTTGSFSSSSAGVLAAVETSDEKWKLIDEKGQQKGANTYAKIFTDEFDRAVVKDRYFAIPEGEVEYSLFNLDGTPVCDLHFEDLHHFSDSGNLAAVKINGAYQFIDTNCNIAFSGATFDDARSLSNGMAAVKKGTLWGYIDENANQVIDAQFAKAGDFSESGEALIQEATRANTNFMSTLQLYSKMSQ
jgi:hypothetical protein